MAERRCRYCEQIFQPSKYQPGQLVCSQPGCQRCRRADYYRQKIAADSEYRQVCPDSPQKWHHSRERTIGRGWRRHLLSHREPIWSPCRWRGTRPSNSTTDHRRGVGRRSFAGSGGGGQKMNRGTLIAQSPNVLDVLQTPGLNLVGWTVTQNRPALFRGRHFARWRLRRCLWEQSGRSKG
jgi:hypothetical protein